MSSVGPGEYHQISLRTRDEALEHDHPVAWKQCNRQHGKGSAKLKVFTPCVLAPLGSKRSAKQAKTFFGCLPSASAQDGSDTCSIRYVLNGQATYAS
jgi:hypothetical protein